MENIHKCQYHYNIYLGRASKDSLSFVDGLLVLSTTMLSAKYSGRDLVLMDVTRYNL